MIEQNIKVEVKEPTAFPPLPKDVYQVELVNLESEEKATYNTRFKPAKDQSFETVLSFQFTLLEGEDNGESLRGRNVWSNFIPTYIYEGKKGKNKLMRILEAFYGHDLTEEEKIVLGDYNKCKEALNSLIGKQIRVSVEPKASATDATKIYDNVADWLKAGKQLEPLAEDEKTVVSKKEDSGTKEEDSDPELAKALEDANKATPDDPGDIQPF